MCWCWGPKRNILSSYGFPSDVLQGNVWIKQAIDDNINATYQDINQIYNNSLICINGNLYAVAVGPILDLKMKNSSEGAAVFGRKIDEAKLKVLENKYNLDLTVCIDDQKIEGDGIPDDKIAGFYQKNIANGGNIYEDANYTFTSIPIVNPIEGKQADLLIGKSTAEFAGTYQTIRRSALIACCMVLILVLIFGFLFSKSITSSLREMERKIRSMGENCKLEPIDVEGSREVKTVIDALNSLSDKIKEQEESAGLLQEKIIIDGLTGLFNHKHFYEKLQQISTLNATFSILFIDIDFFKMVNDNFGHANGDCVLRKIGFLIQNIVGSGSPAFRYGGEEFTAILYHTDAEIALSYAEKIRIAVRTDSELQQFVKFVPVSVSIGIASYPKDSLELDDLVKKADKAMYYAKNQGRDQCINYFTGIEDYFDSETSDFKQDSVVNAAFALAAATDVKDFYTAEHSAFIIEMVMLIGEKLGFNSRERYNLRLSALLYDCGKIGVPDYILNKTAPLTEDEWKIIRNHAESGAAIIKYLVASADVYNCVLYHHEWWNGSGYPEGLKGEEIPLGARIIHVVDSYNAMITDRPYRKALSNSSAIEQLILFKGKQFDPAIVDCFLGMIADSREVS